MLVGVEVVEVVWLLAESNAGVASAELLHQEGVVLLHNLPDQLAWNRSHWSLACCITETNGSDKYKTNQILIW